MVFLKVQEMEKLKETLTLGQEWVIGWDIYYENDEIYIYLDLVNQNDKSLNEKILVGRL